MLLKSLDSILDAEEAGGDYLPIPQLAHLPREWFASAGRSRDFDDLRPCHMIAGKAKDIESVE